MQKLVIRGSSMVKIGWVLGEPSLIFIDADIEQAFPRPQNITALYSDPFQAVLVRNLF